MHAGCAGPPECFRGTGDGGPKHPSVFGADRVDILNVHKLLFCFKIRFCETDKPGKLMSRLRIAYCAKESAGGGPAAPRRAPRRRAAQEGWGEGAPFPAATRGDAVLWCGARPQLTPA